MGAWTNHKATAISRKEIRRGRLSKPVKPTDLMPGVAGAAAKAVEGEQQDAAIRAVEILAAALLDKGPVNAAGTRLGQATITMSGTASQPPAVGDVISVAVTIAAVQADEKEATVAGRV
jgi:hypothetical protein